MAAKKYIVRNGFVVVLKLTRDNGDTYERTYTEGEECTLEDTDAALHAHKLEFANARDRDAAVAAEKTALESTRAAQNPADLVAALVAALAQAQAAAAPAVAAA